MAPANHGGLCQVPILPEKSVRYGFGRGLGAQKAPPLFFKWGQNSTERADDGLIRPRAEAPTGVANREKMIKK